MSNKPTARIRALDEIAKNQSNPFEPNNPLFKNYISYFDEVFNKGGIRSDINYYVNLANNFEGLFLENVLNPVRNARTHKAVLLKGKVGRGKTTFIRNCVEKLIPEKFGNVLVFYLDAEAFRENAKREFEENLKDTIRLELEKIIFSSPFDFQKEFVKFLGFTTRDQVAINTLYKSNLSLSNLFKFLDGLKLADDKLDGGIVIVIDNIDENPKEVLMEGDSFAKELKKIADEVCQNKSLTLLVAVREYNVQYFDTNHYFPTDLPKANTKQIVQSKIRELSEKINQETNDYSQVIDYAPRDYTKAPQSKTITITGPLTIYFLDKVVEYLDEAKDSKIMTLLEETSAGNLKVVVANVFNMLQSTKLPLTELFAKCFTPDDARLPDEIRDPLKFEIILQSLLGIHYPYFCFKESRIMNLFNCRNLSGINDFHCVLIIPRILFFLDDTKARTYKEMEDFFVLYSYDKKYVERAIEKCFAFGLFDTSYGTKISHIDKEKTRITLSSAGKYYISKLILEVSYLQYVCEDTYVQADNYVPITSKYHISESKDHQTNRLESARQLIRFVKACEERELEQIRENKHNVQSYLDQTSAVDETKGTGIRISEYLEKNCFPIISILRHSQKI